MKSQDVTLHASCAAFEGKAVLITGGSGSGKSGLTLQLLSRGANLIADDGVLISRKKNTLLATCPFATRGLIEARGIGILRSQTEETATINCVVDLMREEPERLPPRRLITILGVEVDLIYSKNTPNLADALTLYLRYGRHA